MIERRHTNEAKRRSEHSRALRNKRALAGAIALHLEAQSDSDVAPLVLGSLDTVANRLYASRFPDLLVEQVGECAVGLAMKLDDTPPAKIVFEQTE